MMSLRVTVLVLLTGLCSVNGQSGCLSDQRTQGNIRYSYHENDCNQYRQCHVDTNEYLIVYRSCPHGQYWNQATLQCDPKDGVNCPIASCSGTTPLEGGGCRAHWECSNRVVSSICCAPGLRYTHDQGCIPDFTCMDPCPGPCAENPVCRSFPHWDRTNYYYKNENGSTSYEKICPGGTHFDILECGCVRIGTSCNPDYSILFSVRSELQAARNFWLTDQNLNINANQAEFQSGSLFRANIRLDQPTVDNPLLIKFSFREPFPSARTRNLLLSNDCLRCHQLKVDMTRGTFGDTFQVTLRKFNRIVSQITLSTQGFSNNQWKHVVVWYSGRELLAIIRSEGITYMKRTEAPELKIMNCGFEFGSQSSEPFIGHLARISVYTCNPGGRVIDLVPGAISNAQG